jgi:hypothetical protein
MVTAPTATRLAALVAHERRLHANGDARPLDLLFHEVGYAVMLSKDSCSVR